MYNLDKRSVVPLYYQLAEHLRSQIRTGELSTGGQVPTERDLMQTYSLSRNTVRQALSLLERDGLIRRDQGHGTYVSDLSNNFQYMLDTFVENSDLLRRAGYTPTLKQVSTQRISPPEFVSTGLGIPREEDVFCHTMIFLADDKPAMYTQDYLPVKMVGANNLPIGGEGFWEYLERSSSKHIEYILVDISPIEAAGEIAAAFQCPVGSPILLFQETFLDESQKIPIVFSLNYFNREVLNFRLLTKRG